MEGKEGEERLVIEVKLGLFLLNKMDRSLAELRLAVVMEE